MYTWLSCKPHPLDNIVIVLIPAQRPVTRSFHVFFDLRLNKRLSKQLWDWWFETPPRSLWRHSNDLIGRCCMITLPLLSHFNSLAWIREAIRMGVFLYFFLRKTISWWCITLTNMNFVLRLIFVIYWNGNIHQDFNIFLDKNLYLIDGWNIRMNAC